MENRLLRNEHDKVIAGVSSGLAAYMQVDVTIIRLLFVLSTFFLVGTGVLVYLVMWIVVPVNNDPAARFTKFNDYFKKQNSAGFDPMQPFGSTENTETQAGAAPDWTNPADFKTLRKGSDTGRTIGGLFLLVIGLYFLMNEFNIIPYWFSLSKLWPLVFVAIGLSFILKSKRKNDWENWKSEQEDAAGNPTAAAEQTSEVKSTPTPAGQPDDVPVQDFTTPKSSGIDLGKNTNN